MQRWAECCWTKVQMSMRHLFHHPETLPSPSLLIKATTSFVSFLSTGECFEQLFSLGNWKSRHWHMWLLPVFAGVPILMYETRKETLLCGWQRMVVILTWSSSWSTLVLMWMQQTTARLLHLWLLFARCSLDQKTLLVWHATLLRTLLTTYFTLLLISGSCEGGPVHCERSQPVPIRYWMHEIYCHHCWQGKYWFMFPSIDWNIYQNRIDNRWET